MSSKEPRNTDTCEMDWYPSYPYYEIAVHPVYLNRSPFYVDPLNITALMLTPIATWVRKCAPAKGVYERECVNQLECSKCDVLMVHYSSYMQW